MKKFLLRFAALVAVLIIIMLVRAGTAFEDMQVEPALELPEVTLDQAAVVERFAAAIRFPTISHDDRSNFDAAAFSAFGEYLRESFPLVHERAQRTVISDYSLVFHIAGSDPSLKPVLFMGHMDVVPVDAVTLEQWTHGPFDGVVEDGVIWGRGALDDKLSVMSFLEATEALLRDGHEPSRSLYLSFGHDEEVGGADGAQQIVKHFQQQNIEFEFVLDEGGLVTEGMLGFVDRPVAIIGVGEKGYVNLRLTVNAPGGHSSQPPPQTALGIVSRAVVKVEDNPFPAQFTYMQLTFDHLATYSSFTNRLAMGNTWLLGPVLKSLLIKDKTSAATLRTTTAATMATGSSKSNILPTRAEAVINFRVMPGETTESVRDRVIELIDDERVEVTMEYVFEPTAISPTDSMGYELLSSMIRGFDENILVAPYLVQGGTDARFFHPLSPNIYRFIMVRAKPETLAVIHGINERIAVEDYLLAIRFYYAFMQRVTE
ncbi:MAG: M20 family peptidase [Woeseiaceae bacterium]